MKTWSSQEEEELSSLIKDWLKQQNRTQADLRQSLNALSSRMPALLEVIEKEYRAGGIIKVAARLCAIEAEWYEEDAGKKIDNGDQSKASMDSMGSMDPFNQLDFLLQTIRDDCSEV